MTRNQGWAIVLALALPGISAAAEPTATVSGRVVTVDGKPVPGASVWCENRRDVLSKTQADDQGRFKLGPIKVDIRPTVWAEGPDLARDRIENIALFPSLDSNIGDLSLSTGTRLTGRAVDAQGKPLGGAEITVVGWRHILGHTIDHNGPEWKLSSGTDGRFTTAPLPAGTANVSLFSPGKVRTAAGKVAVPGLALVDLGDIKLEDEQPLAGVVVDKKSGKPVANVTVYADYDYEHSVVTDKDGRFRIGGVGKAAKTISLNCRTHFAPKPLPIEGDRLNLKLPMQRAFQIKGNVVDADTGEPVNITHAQLCQVRKDPDGSTVLQG